MTDVPPGQTSARAVWPWVFALVALAAGTAASAFLWRSTASAEAERLHDEFRLEAEALRQSTSREIRLFLDVLDTIRHLHSISDRISPADFGEFVSKGMLFQQQVLGGYGFVQRIPAAMRDAIEAVTPGSEPFVILERSDNGDYVRAARRADYFPLTYQTPEGAMSVPVGYDFGADEADQETIRHMAVSGKTVVNGEVRSSNGRPPGYYLFAPIMYRVVDGVPYRPPGYLMGFAVTVLRPQQILDRVSQNTSTRHISMELLAREEAGEDVTTAAGDAFQYHASLPVADHTWTFRCSAGPEYVAARRTRQAETILLAGLAITILLTSQFVFLARQTRQIERVVQRRTADLVEAKERLEKEMAERMRLESEILEITTREKERVGLDLHDSLGQKLAGAIFMSRTLVEHLSDTGGEDLENAKRINDILKDTVGQVRRVARGLAPVELTDEGLADALKGLAEDARDMLGMECEFRADGERRLADRKTAVHLYHIAQEAVSNAARHGRAAHGVITLSIKGGDGVLTVEDDGMGIPNDAEERGGLGLRIMRYRAAMFGGSLDVRRRARGGTVLTCRFRAG